jgi:hypothetical protein
MKIKLWHCLTLILLCVLICALLVYGQRRLDQYRIKKVDFIVWYIETQGDSDFEEDILDGYFSALKCQSAISNGVYRIHYKSVFANKKWTLDMNKAKQPNTNLNPISGSSIKLPEKG